MRCPVCKFTNNKFLFQSCDKHGRHVINIKDTFSVNRCLNCECIFLSRITIDDDYYKKYYANDYYETQVKHKNTLTDCFIGMLESHSINQKHKNILKYAESRNRKLKILDIGCGDGGFLNRLDEKKFEKYGIEIHKAGIELSRKKGLTIYDQDIMKIDFGHKQFDVITLLHVLEHLEDPISIFKKIHSILENDGILLFSTPNTTSLGFQFGQQNWFHLDSPRHLILFNNTSAKFLCDKTKFKILNSIHEYYDYPLDLFWSLSKSPLKYIVYPIYPLAKFFDREILTVVCRK